MTTVQQMVAEFHRVFDCTVDNRSSDTFGQRLDLIDEEYTEVRDEFENAISDEMNGYPLDNLPDIAKELADLVYVAYGAAVSLGIDLDEAVRKVHKSNMSKTWPDGRARVRGDGKILKPPTYQPPDMRDVVKEL